LPESDQKRITHCLIPPWEDAFWLAQANGEFAKAINQPLLAQPRNLVSGIQASQLQLSLASVENYIVL
jgi:hypothetical protein